MHLIPALGASMALCDMVLLIKKMLDSSHVQYHEWIFRFSQFSVWVSFELLYLIMNLFATPILIRHTFSGYHSSGLEVWVLLCCLLQPHLMYLVDVEISSFSTPFTKRIYFSSGTTCYSQEILYAFLCSEFLKMMDLLDL